GRLQPRSAFIRVRRDHDQGHRHDRQGLLVVRQRMGLLQPHARHHAGVVEGLSEMTILRMTDLELRDKRVLIREDLNVPVQDGAVTSDARSRAPLPTIQAARDAGARVLVMSHLGRPEEGVYNEEFSLAPVAKRLAELLGFKVRFEKNWLDCVECAPGEVVLLENVRFNKGEKKDKEDLAKRMAALCDIYVMDAFGTAHRAEASTHGVARFAKVACAGPLLMNELIALETALDKPKRPLIADVAGSKVSTK